MNKLKGQRERTEKSKFSSKEVKIKMIRKSDLYSLTIVPILQFISGPERVNSI